MYVSGAGKICDGRGWESWVWYYPYDGSGIDTCLHHYVCTIPVTESLFSDYSQLDISVPYFTLCMCLSVVCVCVYVCVCLAVKQ